MPLDKNIKIKINGQELDLGNTEDLPLTISFALEDIENFQSKKGSKALNVMVPASLTNDKIGNTFHNPGVEDLTTDNIFENNRSALIEANGYELLVGKAFLIGVKHTDRPTQYEFNFYGHNSDWVIDLKETTLHDFVKDITFSLTKPLIEASWAFDGTDINLPYVFAPVRYGQPFYIDPTTNNKDYNITPLYLKPSLSKYWILYKAFKSIGYTIQSEFLDTPYFRRQVMPWTWSNFLATEGEALDNLDFLAKTDTEFDSVLIAGINTGDIAEVVDLKVTNDNFNGGFDNNGVYEYDAPNKAMTWTYLPAYSQGLIGATFHIAIWARLYCEEDSRIRVRTQWFKNGVKVDHGDDDGNGTLLIYLDSSLLGSKRFEGYLEDWATFNVMPGDIITCKVWVQLHDTATGNNSITLAVDEFELDYISVPLGGTVNFANYQAFKKHKFLDFLGGVVDEFNLTIAADSVNKVVYIEPQHDYSLVHSQAVKSGGYFNGDFIDWTSKQDISKESSYTLFSEYERELLFKYKEDGNDGATKILKDRNTASPALAKYLFPDRFKAGKKEIENRFFSNVAHCNIEQWKTLTGEAPQMIALLPENISNTSRDVSQHTFEPKSAYYKGLEANTGWVWDGVVQNSFPFMFAVNYKPGGEEDPILSYCDEKIGIDPTTVMGIGLLRRFFLQRLEILRNGQFYRTYFKLNNYDISNHLHREHVIVNGQRWEVVEINNYKPLLEESTEVVLRKWSPIRGI